MKPVSLESMMAYRMPDSDFHSIYEDMYLEGGAENTEIVLDE